MEIIGVIELGTLHSLKGKLIFVLLVVFIFSACSGLFAQSKSLQDHYNEITNFVSAKNSDGVRKYLADNTNNSDYAKLESFVLMRSRDALIANDLDFALSLCLTVIDNNLDNFEAVALYTSIERAVFARDEKIKTENEKIQIEKMKETAVTTKEKEKIQKEYKTITNSVSGETVYLDQEFDMYYLPVTWGVDLGLADISVMSDPLSTSFRYGLSLAGNVFYRSEEFYAGIDVFFDAALVSFPAMPNLVFSVKAVPSFSLPRVLRNIYYRVGYAGIYSSTVDNSFLPPSFSSPVIGVGFRDWRFGVFFFDGSFDYYIGHLFYDNFFFAADANVNFYLPLADLDTIDVGLNLGIRDIMGVMAQGLHNQIKFVISVGVWNND